MEEAGHASGVNSPGRVNPQCELCTCDLPGIPTTPLLWMTDEAHGIRLGVIPAAGGELTSLQVRLAGGWTELLHRALAYDAWPCPATDERAPLLWPAVGRSFTSEQISDWKRTGRPPAQNRYQVGGKVYEIDVHGFARNLPWQLDSYGTREGSAYVRCSISASTDTLRIYPFQFNISTTYSLGGGGIAIEYEVVAGQNGCPMPFSIGNHLSLRMPFTSQGQFEKCTLRTPGSVIWQQNALCLLSGERTAVDLSSPTPVSRKELLDTVLGGFPRGQVWVELDDPANLRLRVSQSQKNLDGKMLAAEEDFYFVFWGDPALQYFCPEPWIGRPNSLNTGEGCVCLDPGQRFLWEIRLAPEVRA